MNLIETKNLTVAFDGRKILEQVSFRLAPGEVVGLIGPNGAGKSTLLKTLAGMLRAREGEIFLFGKDARGRRSPEFAKKISYIPQNASVDWPLAARQVVALGRIPHLAPWQNPSEKDEQAVEEALRAADVFSIADRPVDHLAGGEKSLVMIARALATEPAVLLADEPTAGLDPHHELQIMELLQRLAGEGRGIVIVLHQLSLAARFCDRIYMMKQGRMIAEGGPKKVLSAETLRECYNIETYSGCHDGKYFVIPWKRV